MARRKKYILSIGGCGMRGLIALRILESLESRMRLHGKSGPIYRYFDLMCGTSAGGLIAAALAAPAPDGKPHAAAATVADLRRFFEEEAGEVFARDLGRRIGRLLVNPRSLFDGKYDARLLEAKLKERFGWTSLHSARTGLALTAYDIAARRAMVLTNGTASDGRLSDDFYIWQAVRASMATPAYFEPAEVENLSSGASHCMVDGAVFAADPVLVAYVEARKLGWKAKNIVIVSLGAGDSGLTGYPAFEALDWDALRWISPGRGAPLLSVVGHGQATAAAHQASWLFAEREGCEYLRFDGALPAGADLFDNVRPGNVIGLNGAADRIIRDNTIALDRLAERLTPHDTVTGVPA